MLKSIIHDPTWLLNITAYFYTGVDPDAELTEHIECHSANGILYIYVDRDIVNEEGQSSTDCWIIYERDSGTGRDDYAMLTTRDNWIAFYVPDYFK